MPRGELTTFLFDLDGTLIDSVDLIIRSYRHTMQVHRGSTPSDEIWLAGLGTPLWSQFRSFTDDPEEIEAMVKTYRDFNLENHDALVREFPGVLEAVRQLRDRGEKLGVVTSKLTDAARRGLSITGFRDCFEVLVGADTLKEHKPDPAPVRRALDLLRSEPEETVFVGDSPHDLVAGQRAGVRVAAVAWGPFNHDELRDHGPDYWIADPAELLTLA